MNRLTGAVVIGTGGPWESAEWPVWVFHATAQVLSARRVTHLAAGVDGSAAFERAIRCLPQGRIRTGALPYERLRRVDETCTDALGAGATCQPSTWTECVGSTAEGADNRRAVPVPAVP